MLTMQIPVSDIPAAQARRLPTVVNPTTLGEHLKVPVGYNIHAGLPADDEIGYFMVSWFFNQAQWCTTLRRLTPGGKLEEFERDRGTWISPRIYGNDGQTVGVHWLEPIFAESP